MSKRDPNLLISDILESLEKINKYTAGFTYEMFILDSKTCDAVIRNFEIIGEAANRLPEDFKIVWTIIQNDIDKLKSDLSMLNE